MGNTEETITTTEAINESWWRRFWVCF
jgi:hypothetical protein